MGQRLEKNLDCKLKVFVNPEDLSTEEQLSRMHTEIYKLKFDIGSVGEKRTNIP